MLLRAITFAGGLAGAAGLSQFPEFSQQYVQRLGGAVDELQRFAAEFDADAAGLDLTRDEALAQLAQGGDMGAARAETMAGTLERHQRLATALDTLKTAGPFTRFYNVAHLTDQEIAAQTWNDFKPALPLSFEGAVFGATGYLAGYGVLGGVLWLLVGPFRRRRKPTRAPETPDGPPDGPPGGSPGGSNEGPAPNLPLRGETEATIR